MKIGDRVKFSDVPLGMFFTDHVHIWKRVKSGEVYGQSYAPDCPVMYCYEILVDTERRTDSQHHHVKGKWTEDFFSHTFTYLGIQKAADHFIAMVAQEKDMSKIPDGLRL